jgi:hypothetical protein
MLPSEGRISRVNPRDGHRAVSGRLPDSPR